jgi:hypothetical protein
MSAISKLLQTRCTINFCSVIHTKRRVRKDKIRYVQWQRLYESPPLSERNCSALSLLKYWGWSLTKSIEFRIKQGGSLSKITNLWHAARESESFAPTPRGRWWRLWNNVKVYSRNPIGMWRHTICFVVCLHKPEWVVIQVTKKLHLWPVEGQKILIFLGQTYSTLRRSRSSFSIIASIIDSDQINLPPVVSVWFQQFVVEEELWRIFLDDHQTRESETHTPELNRHIFL